jgi:hypothetical protein
LIPKSIHQIWVSQKDVPSFVYDHDRRWSFLFPLWKRTLWTEKKLLSCNMPNHHLFVHTENLEVKANIARYYLLQAYGGIVADGDIEPIKNFEHVLDRPLVVAEDGNGSIGVPLIVADPAYPVLDRINLSLDAEYRSGRPTDGRFVAQHISDTGVNLLLFDVFYASLPGEKSLAFRHRLMPHSDRLWFEREEVKTWASTFKNMKLKLPHPQRNMGNPAAKDFEAPLPQGARNTVFDKFKNKFF